MSTLTVDGRAIPIHAGDSVAAVIMRTGTLIFRRSRSGEPRGLYCGIGVCNDCLVTVDGRPNLRACVTPAVAGATVETGTATR
jgi:predicted molibdopterin-dependent oxidoreductase YjgC